VRAMSILNTKDQKTLNNGGLTMFQILPKTLEIITKACKNKKIADSQSLWS